jgi:phage tail sheath gpL-like
MSDTKNVKLGVCRIYFGGLDLGYTKGGVEVTVATETYKSEVDQFGKTPIAEFITARTIMVKAPLAETTLYNAIAVLPGATMTATGGSKASSTVTFATTPPIEGNTVTVNGSVFKFTATKTGPFDISPLPATIADAATALAAAVNDRLSSDMVATNAAGVATLTARAFGTAGNAYTLAKNGANITVGAATFTGGVDPSKIKVSVPTNIGANLLQLAKKLVIRPIALDRVGDKSEDIVIPLAATAGSMNFAFKNEEERVFNSEFNGYPNPATGELFVIGDDSAT